jgi:YgiT-type zinc finger domain-containing protein
MTSLFGYQCEYCEGMVRAKHVDREAFKHKTGFVILEDVVIGVCNKCGNRYYTAETLKQVQSITLGKVRPERTERVPVAHAQ